LLSFDPKREPTVPRHASTVVVVRDGAPGLEVFSVLRHARSTFLGGAVVFPGGKVDPSDEHDAWAAQTTAPHPRAEALVEGFGGNPTVSARALAVAACRETLEEGRILPLDAPIGDAGVEALRLALLASPGSLCAALAAQGRKLALDALVPWARWVTPGAEARRFDARFYLLELPPGQVGRHDEHETTMSSWDRPAAVLERFARGEIFLAPPTTRTLELLATCRDVRAARSLAMEQSLLPVCPSFQPDAGDGAPFLALPGDPTHEVRERRVSGPTRFVLRDGRFVSEDPPAAAGAGGEIW
jgi:8-oxo-dGTP pyrophosphatase MutT (NUDIX family)